MAYITLEILKSREEVALELVERRTEITLEEAGGQHYEVYQGAYEVRPDVAEQLLDTAWKLMTDDLMVHKIPYFETSNNSGGTTVYIADEIEIS